MPANTAVLLADPADPYYPLAGEISQAESLPVAGTLEEALARKPAFLIWVASPAGLSDRALVDFSTALLDETTGISVGIISGRTLEEARSLWLRAEQARAHPAFAANGTYPAAGVLRAASGPTTVKTSPKT